MKKEETAYFYLADPKNFNYTIWINLLFRKKGDQFINRKDKSIWKEYDNYYYYGDSTKALIREGDYSFEFMFDLFLNSKVKYNIFGALNYMLKNYHSDFVNKINVFLDKSEHSENIVIYLKYFS